jgi:hypothetical protein
MSNLGIPEGAMIALTDMVDNLAEIEPGMDVILLAHKDGLYGGVNYVDEEAVAWASSVVTSRCAHSTVMWIDEPIKVHKWRYPPVVKAAVAAADVLINTSSVLVTEEIPEFREHLEECKTWMVRMFPSTKELLMTDWAQTPYELRTDENDASRRVPPVPGSRGRRVQIRHDRSQRHAYRGQHDPAQAASRHPRARPCRKARTPCRA